MQRIKVTLSLLLLLSLTAFSCESKQEQKKDNEQTAGTQTVAVESPFSSENAYEHLQKQVDFGPRVPNTDSHAACLQYLYETLAATELEVQRQPMELTAYDGTVLRATNLIASYKLERTSRVMLFAHWDTRPMADHDSDPALRDKPIDGADDGASGTAVLLELARIIAGADLKNIGVDILLFDAEDYGVPEGVAYNGRTETTWALGTQYWTKQTHVEDYKADFGILLDMVGAKEATFYREYFSVNAASRYVNKIWATARSMGHSKYFINEMGGAITDDHYFVIENLRIPCVNIVNYNPSRTKGFGDYWHTHQDNMDNISKETLQAVGETVWKVLLDYDAEQGK